MDRDRKVTFVLLLNANLLTFVWLIAIHSFKVIRLLDQLNNQRNSAIQSEEVIFISRE